MQSVTANELAADLVEVIDIEQQVFQAPWSEDDFLKHIRRGCSFFCVKHDGEVIAYAIVKWRQSGARIENIATVPSKRRYGIGTRLVEFVKNELQPGRVIIAIVSETNQEAIAFWHAAGFQAVKVWRHYYTNGRDAYVFQLIVKDDPSEQGSR